MTAATQSDVQSDPKQSSSSDSKSKSKRSKISSGAADLIKALEDQDAPKEIIAAIRKVDVSWNVMAEQLTKERELRMAAQLELASARTKINILEIELEVEENKKGAEKYEGIEDAGAW